MDDLFKGLLIGAVGAAITIFVSIGSSMKEYRSLKILDAYVYCKGFSSQTNEIGQQFMVCKDPKVFRVE